MMVMMMMILMMMMMMMMMMIVIYFKIYFNFVVIDDVISDNTDGELDKRVTFIALIVGYWLLLLVVEIFFE